MSPCKKTKTANFYCATNDLPRMTHVCVRGGRESSRPFWRNSPDSRRVLGTRHDSVEFLRFSPPDFIVMIEGSAAKESAAVAALCQRHVEREGVVMIEK